MSRTIASLWSGRSFTSPPFLPSQVISPAGVAELVAAEGEHHALRPGIQLLHAAVPAEPLQRHHLQQIVDLLRQFAEPIDQFRSHRLALGIRLKPADASIQAKANRQVLHVGFRNQDRQTQPDIRCPVPRRGLLAALLGADVGHRILQHLLIELDAHLTDMPALLVAQKIAGTANIEVVGG